MSNKDYWIQIKLDQENIQVYEGLKILQEGEPMSKDDYKGIGLEESLLRLAAELRNGGLLKKDKKKCIYYLQEAIKLGSGNAAMELSHVIEHDWWWGKSSWKVDHQEYKKIANQLWVKDVEKGDHSAAWELFHSHRIKNPEEAKKWSDKALELARVNADENWETIKFYESETPRLLKLSSFS